MKRLKSVKILPKVKHNLEDKRGRVGRNDDADADVIEALVIRSPGRDDHRDVFDQDDDVDDDLSHERSLLNVDRTERRRRETGHWK